MRICSETRKSRTWDCTESGSCISVSTSVSTAQTSTPRALPPPTDGGETQYPSPPAAGHGSAAALAPRHPTAQPAQQPSALHARSHSPAGPRRPPAGCLAAPHCSVDRALLMKAALDPRSLPLRIRQVRAPQPRVDVKSAFQNCELYETVYVVQPGGLGHNSGRVWRLKTALYGSGKKHVSGTRCWSRCYMILILQAATVIVLCSFESMVCASSSPGLMTCMCSQLLMSWKH